MEAQKNQGCPAAVGYDGEGATLQNYRIEGEAHPIFPLPFPQAQGEKGEHPIGYGTLFSPPNKSVQRNKGGLFSQRISTCQAVLGVGKWG